MTQRIAFLTSLDRSIYAGARITQTPPTVQTTTEAAVITEFGGPEMLHHAQVPLPKLGDEQVQVHVAAIGVNLVDLSTRAGKNIPDSDARFPMVLAWDVAGMIFQPIDQRGTYAEYVNFDVSLFARIRRACPCTRRPPCR